MRWEDWVWDCWGISQQDLPDSEIEKLRDRSTTFAGSHCPRRNKKALSHCRKKCMWKKNKFCFIFLVLYTRTHTFLLFICAPFSPPHTTTLCLILLPLHGFTLGEKEGVSAWTDVGISAGCLWIITLPLTPLCYALPSIWAHEGHFSLFHLQQLKDIAAVVLFHVLGFSFLNQAPNWRLRRRPAAGISWSSFRCLVRVTGHPVSSKRSLLFCFISHLLSSFHLLLLIVFGFFSMCKCI